MPNDTRVSIQSGDDLAQFRYYTGAQPTPLPPNDPCPPLFRDVGLEAMATFLQGGLRRLCGPISPITFLRTAGYCEPYTDYGRIGRIMLLRPQQVHPWHSGVDPVYICARQTAVCSDTMVFIPPEVSLQEAAARFPEARSLAEFQDAYGIRDYRDAAAATSERLGFLQRTHKQSEVLAAPLRRMFQSMEQRNRDRAREMMRRAGLNESDLCTAWHHLPDDRRDTIQLQLLELQKELRQ